MTDRKPTTEQLLRTLRREIFAAEMKVALDKELGRETSSTVKKLAGMKMPPITNSRPEKVEPARTKSRTSGRYVSAKSGAAASGAVSTKQGRVAAESSVSQRSAHSFK